MLFFCYFFFLFQSWSLLDVEVLCVTKWSVMRDGMKQKSTKIAVTWIHLIKPWKGRSHRYIIRRVQKHYTAVIISAVHSFFANNSRRALHKFARVNIQLVCHLIRWSVMIKHLGIHIVKSSYLYLNGPIAVLKSAWFVLYFPVLDCAFRYCVKTKQVLLENPW